MKYYFKLYTDEETIRKQKDKYLITLSKSVQNHLEIFHSVLLIQDTINKDDLFVVGLADSYEHALEIVEKIVQEVYDNTGKTDVKNYILQKQQEYEEGNV